MRTSELSSPIRQYASYTWLLAQAELSRRYSGRLLGPLWALVLPLLTVAVIWIALVYGLNMRDVAGGYSLDLVVGLMAWLFFADAVGNGVYALTANPHLVKKVVFPVILVPVSYVLTSFLVHGLVAIIMCGAFAAFGQLSWTTLFTLPLWMLAYGVFTAAIVTLASALSVIVKDVREIVPALLQILFWTTPIVWPVAVVSERWAPLLLSSPLAVIVQGYRNALLGSDFGLTFGHLVVFALFTLVITTAAIFIFNRLQPIFAEEL
ncbi:MAG: ABC transporter permease [Pseudomonadota bacterium]